MQCNGYLYRCVLGVVNDLSTTSNVMDTFIFFLLHFIVICYIYLPVSVRLCAGRAALIVAVFDSLLLYEIFNMGF